MLYNFIGSAKFNLGVTMIYELYTIFSFVHNIINIKLNSAINIFYIVFLIFMIYYVIMRMTNNLHFFNDTFKSFYTFVALLTYTNIIMFMVYGNPQISVDLFMIYVAPTIVVFIINNGYLIKHINVLYMVSGYFGLNFLTNLIIYKTQKLLECIISQLLCSLIYVVLTYKKEERKVSAETTETESKKVN